MQEAATAKAKAGAAAWILPVLLGIGGSLGTVSLLGSGTYDIAPLKVKMAVSIASSGETVLALDPGPFRQLGRPATAKTHDSPLRFKATIVDVAQDPNAVNEIVTPQGEVVKEPLNTQNPESIAQYLATNGKRAVRAFAIRVGLLALGGGLVGAGIGALGKRKQSIAGGLAGLAVVGILGLIAQQTYDISGFQGLTF